ncbi:MAG: asparagine synthase (glutamine-hydrolyzing) [Anaerolineae bacterium]|nr:asparagine synthase (glutamine-hydrolyzing) [Anaerolineae bacterium]
MCGICGLIDLDGQDRADPALVQRMAETIRHRGPDGDGFYHAPNIALGMRRLSIIDVRGSDQPLTNEDRSIWLVFNGEIYNYRELRDQLKRRNHVLKTEGDGETIIHLYEEYGLNLFNHLRGMYGFALWDARAERLVLAVDHIGMKPLYLHEREGKLLFASEAKALFADPETPRRLNLETLDTYLSFGYMIGAETLFDDIRRLPPGHALVAEKGTTWLHPFWEFPKPAANGQEASETLVYQQARELLADSVHIHLRSDVPLGLFLSGGVDSAAVLALMSREAGGRVKSYTVGYAAETPDNELLHARRIAEHFKTDHHERVLTAEDWWDGLHKTVYHHDEPIANESAVSLLLLAEHTAREVKVVLTGLGGDELFGGYTGHRALPQLLRDQQSWGRLLPAGSLQRVEAYYPTMKRYRIVGAIPTYLPRWQQAGLPRDEAIRRMMSFDGMVFSDALRERLYGPAVARAWAGAHHKEQTYAAIIDRSWRDRAEDTAQALIINTWLSGNALLHTDKVTMASSLEARVPLFDPVLLKFAANIPASIRMKANKVVLREAMRPYLPEWSLERPKQPFRTPIQHWFETALADRIREVLIDPNNHLRGLFQPAALDALLHDHFWGRTRQIEVVFRLLTLELWMQRFGISAA